MGSLYTMWLSELGTFEMFWDLKIYSITDTGILWYDLHGYVVLVLVLVLIKDDLFIKRMLATWHPYTRASFLCQWLQSDTGKCMLSSPPASPLPKYGRNRVRAGRRTKTQPKRVIRANVCLVRHPCHNLAYDTKTVNTYGDPNPSKRYQAQPKY